MRGCDWDIVLTQVDTVSARGHCDVNAIVDNQCDAIAVGNLRRGFDVAEEVDGRQMFFAELHKGRATSDEPPDLFHVA